jgi:TonB family protein
VLTTAALTALCVLGVTHIVYSPPKRLTVTETDKTVVIRVLEPLPVPAPPAFQPPVPQRPETPAPAQSPSPAKPLAKPLAEPLAEPMPAAVETVAETAAVEVYTEPAAPAVTEAAPAPTDINSFIGEFRAVIQETLYYPKNARRAGITGEVKVRVVFSADGYVLSYELLEGKYHKSLGNAALTTLEDVRAKWKPPLEPGSEQAVIIPIIFEITS